jgi:hypothetical protein
MAARKHPSKLVKAKSPRITSSKAIRPEAKPASAKSSAAKVSKKDRVLAMLRKPEGTSLAAIVTETGWKEHSVRGFFAAVVKKKLKLSLVSQKVGGDRIYRIEKTYLAT